MTRSPARLDEANEHERAPTPTQDSGQGGVAGVRDRPRRAVRAQALLRRSLDEVQSHFGGGHSIQRADELLFMPRRAFQYYVLAFTQSAGVGHRR